MLVADSRASGEAELREADELRKVRRLRTELAEMDPEDAAQRLADQIAATGSNAELLGL
jgi:transcription termination factor Rho